MPEMLCKSSMKAVPKAEQPNNDRCLLFMFLTVSPEKHSKHRRMSSYRAWLVKTPKAL